jgi:hypothetical protein
MTVDQLKTTFPEDTTVHTLELPNGDTRIVISDLWGNLRLAFSIDENNHLIYSIELKTYGLFDLINIKKMLEEIENEK